MSVAAAEFDLAAACGNRVGQEDIGPCKIDVHRFASASRRLHRPNASACPSGLKGRLMLIGVFGVSDG
jgi:hypothetical protein